MFFFLKHAYGIQKFYLKVKLKNVRSYHMPVEVPSTKRVFKGWKERKQEKEGVKGRKKEKRGRERERDTKGQSSLKYMMGLHETTGSNEITTDKHVKWDSNQNYFGYFRLYPSVIVSTVCTVKCDSVHCMYCPVWQCPLYVLFSVTVSTICTVQCDSVHCMYCPLWQCPLYVLSSVTVSTVCTVQYYSVQCDSVHCMYCPVWQCPLYCTV